MNVMRLFLLFAAVAPLAAPAWPQTIPLQSSIDQQEASLAQARASHNTRQLVTELNILGSMYRAAGQLQKSLTYLNEALPIEQRYSSLLGQATTLTTMGRVYTDLGQPEKARSLLDQALPLWRSLGNRTGEAEALNYIGKIQNDLGQRDQAIATLNQSLAIWHSIDGGAAASSSSIAVAPSPAANPQSSSLHESALHAGEAGTLDNLGRSYSDMGQGQQALDYFNQALPIWRSMGERSGEALTLNDMGPAYAGLGQKQKALESYNQALAIWRDLGARQGEALTLNNIGRLYRDLGQHQTALDYYNQALPAWREVGNRSGEALALSDMGRAYADLHQPQKALDFANQALPIFRETGSRRGEAMTLNNMGRDNSDMRQAQQAMDLDLQALAIWREIKDQRNEAQALMTIAWAYSEMNQPDQSLASALAALGLAKATGDPEIEGNVETSIMLGFRKQHRTAEAIFFGLEAVNAYQQIRKNIAGLDKELQAGFAQSRSGAYRTLAELLMEAGRLGQAEQILDLLKEQELKDIVTGAASGAASRFEPLQLSPAQQEVETELPDIETKARFIEESRLAWSQLQAKSARTPADDAQMKSLQDRMAQAAAAIQSAVAAIDTQLDGQSGVPDTTQSLLQSSLAKLGPRVIGIRILLGDDHAYALIVTATARKMILLPAASADLRAKVFAVLNVLESPSIDPRPQLSALYAVVAAPLENDLKTLLPSPGPQDAVPTLLWSLDDALRYVPMSALYDGNRYLVERFHNVLFTPESYGHIASSPALKGESPRALAMGLSRSYDGMPALPGVIPELDSIVRDPAVPASHGPMDGRLLPDDQFTLAALKSQLGSGSSIPIIHIASHFVLIAGSGDEPFLLMGGDKAGNPNGYEWNLSAMENSPVTFHGTRLLTLSACSTAKDYKSRNGLEMDSLGMVAQQKDAEAVLATLWDVNDTSTSRMMSDFYDRWIKNPELGKAEALRQAQLAFLHGTAASPNTKIGRGFEIDGASPAQSSLGYAHPYYWAPFVLIGNYQ